jgi:signal transduction histidine kinase
LEQIFELVSDLEKNGGSELSVAERQNAIKKATDEVEYDYLKTEIITLLDGIYEGSSRTAEIVKGLRLFSRLDENDLKYSDINQGLDSTLIIVNTLLSNCIELKKSYSQLPPVECYAGQLNQVWLNILTNAIHAVRSRFGEVSGGVIEVGSRPAGEFVEILISDNGSGMTEETKKKLFEPFFTTKEVGEGTGLGLSIVYNTIKKHNGEIHVDSELGVGTTFKILLPSNQPL